MNTTRDELPVSFLKTNDVYDPDKIAADLELIRRYYLKNGYADFRVDRHRRPLRRGQGRLRHHHHGERGPAVPRRPGRLRFARARASIRTLLRGEVATEPGDVYNAEAVEKTLERHHHEAVRRGYAFVAGPPARRPRSRRPRRSIIGYVVEEGPRVYIERINIRGNTRTRDYVIRREFDIGEGDPYNKVLDRPRRAPPEQPRLLQEGPHHDRARLRAPTASSSTSTSRTSRPARSRSRAATRPSDGVIGEVSVSESNFLGRGQFVRVAGQLGQRSQRRRFQLHRAVLPRLPPGGRLRPVLEVHRTRRATRATRTGPPAASCASACRSPRRSGITLRYSLYEQTLKIPNTYTQPVQRLLGAARRPTRR